MRTNDWGGRQVPDESSSYCTLPYNLTLLLRPMDVPLLGPGVLGVDPSGCVGERGRGPSATWESLAWGSGDPPGIQLPSNTTKIAITTPGPSVHSSHPRMLLQHFVTISGGLIGTTVHPLLDWNEAVSRVGSCSMVSV